MVSTKIIQLITQFNCTFSILSGIHLINFFFRSWSHRLRPKKLHTSVAVPAAPVRVPCQRPLAPSVASVTSVANDRVIMKLLSQICLNYECRISVRTLFEICITYHVLFRLFLRFSFILYTWKYMYKQFLLFYCLGGQ